VYFSNLAELVDSLRKAEREGRLLKRVKILNRYSLLIVDEISHMTVGSGGGNLFFQLANACYERSAMTMTGNRGFGEWADIFGYPVVATALLDRLLHHAEVVAIDGNFYHPREHASLIPEHLQNRTITNGESFAEIKRRPGRPRNEHPSSELTAQNTQGWGELTTGIDICLLLADVGQTRAQQTVPRRHRAE
jgi:hypothetical protein